MRTTPDRASPVADDGLDVRTPRRVRTSLLVFAVVWSGLVVWSAVPGMRDGEVGAFGALPFAAIGSFITLRGRRVRAFTRGGELVVRNPWRTLTVRRAEIDDVRTGDAQSGPLTFGRAVMVLLRDGSVVSLEATLRTGWTATGRRDLADEHERLLAWSRRGELPRED